MDCENAKQQIPLLLSGTLSQQEREGLESHLAGCTDCQMDLEVSGKIWHLMAEAQPPVPTAGMRIRFNAELENFKDQMTREKKSWPALKNIFQSLFGELGSRRVAFGSFLLVIGLAGGYFLSRPLNSTVSYNQKIDSLSTEVSEMKQMMMLSLLENPSASERIKAVAYTDDISSANKKVIDALLTTLNEDPNVNVRLMTLEALVKYADQPRVREGLVASIGMQESPLMQSAMADCMVKLQEKSSVKSLQNLLHRKNLNEMVKHKIEQSIHKLI
jgi:hypothetical protein